MAPITSLVSKVAAQSRAARVLARLVTVALLAAACSGGAKPSPGLRRLSAPDKRWRVVAAEVPGGPWAAAPLATGGVWLWGSQRGPATGAGTLLVELDASGHVVHRFPMHGPADCCGQIALAPDGHVWIGAQGTVVEVDPIRGTTHSFVLPGWTTEVAWSLDGLAVDHGGNLLVARDGALSLERLDPTTAMWTTLSLPQPQGVGGLAILADGTLGVAPLDRVAHTWDAFVELGAGSTPLVVPFVAGPRPWVLASAAGFLTGAERAYLVDERGAVTLVTFPGSGHINIKGAAALPDGRLAAVDNGGPVVVAGPSPGHQAVLGLGTAVCRPVRPNVADIAAVPSTASPSAGRACAVAPAGIAADGRGDLYALLFDGTLERAKAGSF